jgi:hypothetical protein
LTEKKVGVDRGVLPSGAFLKLRLRGILQDGLLTQHACEKDFGEIWAGSEIPAITLSSNCEGKYLELFFF